MVKRNPKDFWRDTGGNFIIMFGLMIVPMFLLMGVGIDYYKELAYKSRLDSAADAAAIAAINTAQAYLTVNGTSAATIAQAKANGEAQAALVFYANAGTEESTAAAVPVPYVNINGQLITATVTYSTTVNSHFGGLTHTISNQTMTVNGNAASSLTMSTYLDFYLLLDVSGSMSFPTDQPDQVTLQNYAKTHYGDQLKNYPNGCTFACHGQSSDPAGVAGAMPSFCNIPGNAGAGFCGAVGYEFARALGIALRADSVGAAVKNLFTTALATETNVTHLANEFRVGIYPFIDDAIEAATLSSNLATTSPGYAVAGQMGTYLDQGQNIIPSAKGFNHMDVVTGVSSGHGGNNMGSGGTHFENLWFDLGGTTKIANGNLFAGYDITGNSPPGSAFPSFSPTYLTASPALGAISGATILKGSSTGASASTPQGFIFLVTDGMDNSQSYSVAGGWVPPYSVPQLPDTTSTHSLCAQAKSAGYTMAVLYIPYVQIINPTGFANNEDINVNYTIPSVPADLKNCASPGYFYTASSAKAINDAMQAMFQQATQFARLTQ